MKLVKQYSVMYGQTPTNPVEMTRWIEMGGRTCYKSEDKITQNSSVGFVQKMLKSGHGSVLEHSNIVFFIKGGACDSAQLIAELGSRMAFHQIETTGVDDLYINGNLRAWLDTTAHAYMKDNIVQDISEIFHYHFSFLMEDYVPITDAKANESIISLVTEPNDMPLSLRKYTMRVVTNRAMTHEIVRHRVFSFSQESQRYVNYRTGIEFVIPVWATDIQNPSVIIGVNKIEKEQTAAWLTMMEAVEKVYTSLIISGMKPQQAREILPNSTKTEIVITGGYDAWKWFFHLRDSSAADPQMQDLSAKMLKQFKGAIDGF